jgi:transposase
VSESYEERQIVGMDLHRRRSVLVRMTESGEPLETVRISNDPEYLRQVMARAGEAPEVLLEATYGWYWAADTLAELGAHVHLAHPLGVKMFSYRRVKNDQRDAADLADLLRMGRLLEAWIAPPATRELRGWARHRAKLVGLRSSLKNQVHAVLAAAGVHVPMSDLFGPGGQQLLTTTRLAVESRSRIDSLLRMTTALDFEIDTFARLVTQRLRGDPGFTAIQQIPGVGPLLGAVFVAEIGDITRFTRPQQLASWAGLTPKHHESDTTVHRGRITK